MQFSKVLRTICIRSSLLETTVPLQARCMQTDVAQTKPKRYKYPLVYDPYGPRPLPSEKTSQLADKIASLTPEEQAQIGSAFREWLNHPKLEKISTCSAVMMIKGPRSRCKV